jgi:hypothetical protein
LANWLPPGSAGILPAYCREIKELPIFNGACEERAGCPRSQDAMVNALFSQQNYYPKTQEEPAHFGHAPNSGLLKC